MIRSRSTVVINRPVGEVFAYMADFERLPEHEPWVEKAWRTSDGPVGVGSTWCHIRVMGRRRFEAPIEIVEYEPERRLAIKSGNGPVDVVATQTFEGHGASTTVTEVLEMHVSGFTRLFEPIIRRQSRGQVREVHQRIKRLLEES
ncbi:SRPBCC family protein [Micrococcaceae bacterium Sec5.7]